jgi:hypothetical protein
MPTPRLTGRVIYHGSITALHGRVFLAEECYCGPGPCDTNETYELSIPGDPDDTAVLRHVRRTSITPA